MEDVCASAFILIDEPYLTHASKSLRFHPFKYICRKQEEVIILIPPRSINQLIDYHHSTSLLLLVLILVIQQQQQQQSNMKASFQVQLEGQVIGIPINSAKRLLQLPAHSALHIPSSDHRRDQTGSSKRTQSE